MFESEARMATGGRGATLIVISWYNGCKFQIVDLEILWLVAVIGFLGNIGGHPCRVETISRAHEGLSNLYPIRTQRVLSLYYCNRRSTRKRLQSLEQWHSYAVRNCLCKSAQEVLRVLFKYVPLKWINFGVVVGYIWAKLWANRANQLPWLANDKSDVVMRRYAPMPMAPDDVVNVCSFNKLGQARWHETTAAQAMIGKCENAELQWRQIDLKRSFAPSFRDAWKRVNRGTRPCDDNWA